MKSLTPKIYFKVLGRRWTIRVLSKKKYVKKNGDDSLAITKCHKRTIDLSPWGKDKETLIHELLHAYLSELCVKSADFDTDSLEEVFAELMAKRGRELLSLADRLLLLVRKVSVV